ARRVLPRGMRDAEQSFTGVGDAPQRTSATAAFAAARSGERARLLWHSPEDGATTWDLSLFPMPGATGEGTHVGILGRELPAGVAGAQEAERAGELQTALTRTVLALEAGEIGVW